MRIGIDARFWGPVGKGLGRYTQKLIENLEKLDTENEYFIFLVRENFDAYHSSNKNFHKVLADFRWYSFSEQWSMPWLLNKYKLDLVHFPHFNVPLFYFRPFVITIHDLILLHFPTVRASTRSRWGYWFKFWAYKLVIFSALRRARKIIAVSHFTKRDILENYRLGEGKIEVTHEAGEDFKQREVSDTSGESKILEKYAIIRPYILYVGNAYPHKNLDRLVCAYEMVFGEHPELCLVLVGREEYFYRRLKKAVEAKQLKKIIFTGFMPDADLKAVYGAALAYVFPSLYEGFGLPPLEAMSEGVAVASSDHPCMREILGESALYFKAQDEKSMAEGVEKIITQADLRKELIQKGREQVKKYSWEKMAQKTLDIYSYIRKDS